MNVEVLVSLAYRSRNHQGRRWRWRMWCWWWWWNECRIIQWMWCRCTQHLCYPSIDIIIDIDTRTVTRTLPSSCRGIERWHPTVYSRYFTNKWRIVGLGTEPIGHPGIRGTVRFFENRTTSLRRQEERLEGTGCRKKRWWWWSITINNGIYYYISQPSQPCIDEVLIMWNIATYWNL